MRWLGVIFAAMLVSSGVWAVMPDERLEDPALEERARALSADIRCLVCQNESIDSSNADLARELRLLVRERLSEGDSDQEVLDYLVSRYGDFVLLDPPFKASTYALWFGPIALLILAVAGAVLYIRRQSRDLPASASPGLSPEEDIQVERILNDLNPIDREIPGHGDQSPGESGDRP